MKKFFIKYKLSSCVLACTMLATGVMTYNVYSQNKGYTITSQITNPTGDNPEIHTGEEFEVTYTITSEDIPVTGVNKDIAFVLDTSGSMSDKIGNNNSSTKLKLIQDASKGFVDKFTNKSNGDVNISLIQYSTYAARKTPLLNIFDSNKENKGELVTAIDGLKATGGTNIGDGLRAGYYTLSESTTNSKGKYIIFMTDGKASAYSYTSKGNKNSLYKDNYVSGELNLTKDYPTNSEMNNRVTEYYVDNKKYYITPGTDTNDSQNSNYISEMANLITSYNNQNPSTPINTFVIGVKSGSDNEASFIEQNKKLAEKMGGKAFYVKDAAGIQAVYDEIQTTIENSLIGSVNFDDQLSDKFELATGAEDIGSIEIKQGNKVIKPNIKDTNEGNKVAFDLTFNYTVNADKTKYVAEPVIIKIRYKAMESGDITVGNGEVNVSIPNSGESPSDIPQTTITVKDWPGAKIPVTIQAKDSFGVLSEKYNSIDQKPLLNKYDKYVVNDNTNDNYKMFGKSQATLTVKKTEEFEKVEYQVLRFDKPQTTVKMPVDGWNIIDEPTEGDTYTKEFIFGEEVGSYYIAYQCLSGIKSLKSGVYGPFIIEDKIKVNRAFSKENITPNENVDLNYTITPVKIDSKEIIKGTGIIAQKEIYINQFKVSDIIPAGLQLELKQNDTVEFINEIDSQNNNMITMKLKNPIRYVLKSNGMYEAEALTLSLTGTSSLENNYTLDLENCSYEYMSIIKENPAVDVPLILGNPNEDVFLSVMLNRDTNILGHSIYLNDDNGLLMKLENEDGVNLAKDIPATIGIVVNVNNSEGGNKNYSTRIRLTSNSDNSDRSKIQAINPKVYKLKADGTIGESIEFSGNSNAWISFSTPTGISQYVVVYQYTPTSNLTIYANMQRKIGNNSSWTGKHQKSFKIKLDEEGIPNLF